MRSYRVYYVMIDASSLGSCHKENSDVASHFRLKLPTLYRWCKSVRTDLCHRCTGKYILSKSVTQHWSGPTYIW